ncbi:YceI family protein [Pelagicoccus sp. SDUM812003]|uniref:YceI family protein n=1 Tax=Pelagicoccus sp. SDUM812003 TaxID=3041267 RepID=UPI00280C4B8A|nr:YceI family protein [Pelagicoccus sp. SDUM812003]MDQ8203832.1 YceI family protein [Pelagicoccus sp. SDUM812003]
MLPKPNSFKRLTCESIGSRDGPLVDVRTAEAFAECRIPGSVNHCVYEISFLESFPKAFPDRSTPIAVYGEGESYRADEAAIARLQSLGYEDLALLEGGLASWKGDGRETEGSGTKPPTPVSGVLELDNEHSKVGWVGRNLTNRHDGAVDLVQGTLELDKDRPVGGKVTVDLRTLSCRDISDSDMASVLVKHLQNADFFHVSEHPLASFTLKSAEVLESRTYGQPNYLVRGVLTARGKELELVMEALVERIDNGFVFQANFDFDRVALGARYGSGSLFERLGMHLVNDLVSIDVLAVFKRPDA